MIEAPILVVADVGAEPTVERHKGPDDINAAPTTLESDAFPKYQKLLVKLILSLNVRRAPTTF